METIFTDFGVQPILVSAQIVNFLILLLILKKFLYRPLFKVIEERKRVVCDSLHKAEKIEKHLLSIEDESAQKLLDVSKAAQKILDTASSTANEIITQAHKKAQVDIELMIKNAEQNLLQERKKVEQAMQEEFAQLVIFGIEKTAGKVLEQADHKQIIKQCLNKLN